MSEPTDDILDNPGFADALWLVFRRAIRADDTNGPSDLRQTVYDYVIAEPDTKQIINEIIYSTCGTTLSTLIEEAAEALDFDDVVDDEEV